MTALIKVYQEDKNLAQGAAREKVINDLHFIARVFRSVDRRLDAIDLYRMRLESRVAEMVRYMDRNVPDLTNRGIKLLEELGRRSQEQPDGELPALPQPPRWLSQSLLGHRSIRKPQRRRQPQFIELAREQELSPDVKVRLRLIQDYLQRRVMSPAKVAAFIDRQMGERAKFEAKDFKVESVDELVAFAFVPFLNQMKGKPVPNLPLFTIRRTGGRLDTPLLECSDFIVERKG